MITDMNAAQMEQIKHTVDVAAVVAAVWSVAGVLPPIAALFTIVWLGMQMVMNWQKFTCSLRKMVTNKGNDTPQ